MDIAQLFAKFGITVAVLICALIALYKIGTWLFNKLDANLFEIKETMKDIQEDIKEIKESLNSK